LSSCLVVIELSGIIRTGGLFDQARGSPGVLLITESYAATAPRTTAPRTARG